MNRLEELAFKLVDTGLNASEQAELAQLIASDPAGAQAFLLLLDMESALRGELANVNVSRSIMQHIDRERESRAQSGVLREIKKQLDSGRAKPVFARPASPIPPANTNKRAWAIWFNVAVPAMVILFIGIWFLLKNPTHPNLSQNVTIAAPHIEKPNDEKPPAPVDEFGELVFSEDFANGLPSGWLCGKMETTDLPPGAKGAVRQIVKPGTDHFGIYSNQIRNGKLFDVTLNDSVHITFKTDTSEPVKLALLMKESSSGQEGQLEFMLQNTDRNWRTLHLPITSFKNSRAMQDKKSPVCIGYFLGTQKPDIGLTVARFWITRSGTK